MPIMTLSEVLRLAEERRDALRPVDVADELPSYQFKFPNGATPVMEHLTGDRRLVLSARAESQLLQRLQIPAAFYRRLPENIKWATVNFFAQHGGFERMALLRLVRGNTVRALLSERFCPLDDVDLLPLFGDVVGDEALRVEALDFEEDYSHLRVIFPHQVAEPKPGDVVMTGINLSNSETGMRAVHIDAVVFRLVCRNGLVQAESSGKTTIRHVGQIDRLKDSLATAVRDANQKAHRLLERFRIAAGVRISDPRAALERFASDGTLTQEQLQLAIAAFILEPDPTVYGLVNAVTRAAQQEPTFERRYLMERQGTALLNRLT